MKEKKKYIAPYIWVEETELESSLLTAVSVVKVENGAEGSQMTTPGISLGDESSDENDFSKKSSGSWEFIMD